MCCTAKVAASCGGRTMSVKKGDALLLHPGNEHVICNTGDHELHTLTVMTPNEVSRN
jgi:mannose-6-phosphate isomerase-like protein (cupin superfamily)